MKKVKNYIDADLAKKKVARYKYWSIKDENGITIASSDEDNPDGKSFDEVLDKIIGDNVDAEIQIKYGTNEQSARNNPPYFVKINQEIEWIDPEPEETVNINGVPHKVDKNGNVNITLSQPEKPKVERVESYTTIRDEMEVQLKGLRQEYELKEEKLKVEVQNKIMEQTLTFKEMLIAEKEARLNAREEAVNQAEIALDEKEKEIRDDVKTYLKGVPNALGSIIKDFIKDSAKKKDSKQLGSADQKDKPKKQNKVKFSFVEEGQSEPEPEEQQNDEELEQEIEAEIEKQREMEQEQETGTEETTGDENPQNEENETDTNEPKTEDNEDL